MDYDIVIFWLVFFSCLSALFVALTRFRSIAGGWIAVYLSIMLVAVVGELCHLSALVYAAAAMWVLLVLSPALIARLYLRRFLQQRYSAARRLARVISWLHPADGWRQQPEILRALELAQQGETAAALEILRPFQGVKSRIGFAAVINFYRLTNQWEELSSWLSQNQQAIRREPQFLYYLLRAKGETGDVRGMVELYDLHRQQIGKLIPATLRDSCRLVLFAFCGRRPAVELLFAGNLSVMPAPVREFWLATADLAAGNQEVAKRQFDQLLPAADPPLRLAIQRRLLHLTTLPPPLGAAAERIVDEAAREHGHDENFGAQRSLFSRWARATQILIILNVLMFTVEMVRGGATDLDTLYRLGALFPPAVRAGQWWRLIAAIFLHYGWLHITMNMLALWFLGPFVEFALGFRRYLFTYLLSGIGSMGIVMLFSFGPKAEQLALGASGCIMGLVGATGALMLRGWRQHKALSAKRRLTAMLLIVTTQSVFDFMVPQVSMTAHLSGALIGFAIAMMLRDRLTTAAPRNRDGRL